MKIAVSHTFLKSIVHTPKNVLSAIIQFIRNVESNSQYLRRGERVEGEKYFRVKISNSYRLFFSCEKDFLILLDIRRRNNQTYTNRQTINNEQDEYSGSNYFREIDIPELNIIEEPEIEDCIIKFDELDGSIIPEEYWDTLLQVRYEDELLDLDLPDEYLDYIIDNFSLLPSTPIEELEHETYYSFSSESDLDQYFQQEISASDYIIRNLLLSDEQKSVLEDQTPGPILVKGGPGTGKSILALYKVRQLVESGKKNILFTTYNQALAEQSKDYLKVLLNSNLKDLSVEVKTVSEVAEKIFYETNCEYKICDEKQASLLLDSSMELIESIQYINTISKSYILEEFRIVIDGRGIQSEQDYLDIPRFGRDLPLQKKQRKTIWKIYKKWSDLLDKSGLITREKIKCEVLSHVRLRNKHYFDHIVIDEAQDLSPVSLKLLFSLAPKEELYLTADTDQSLYQRSFSWDKIQHYIGHTGTTKLLRIGFRSSHEIWKAYSNIIHRFRTAASGKKSGIKPEILYTDDPITQVEYIKDFLNRSVHEFPEDPRYAAVILVQDADYGKLLSSQLTRHKLPARYVTRKEQHGISDKWINIMLIKDSKGLEFPYVIVAGLKEGIFPPDLNLESNPERNQLLEQYKHLFYVACSRAKNSLLVCASSSYPSSLLENLNKSYWNIVRK